MFKSFNHRLQSWRLRNIARRKLAMLDDRLLSDIGTRRDAIGDFVRRRSD